MKAVLLSGGMGKRLQPITDYLPKPLVPVYNVPIIEWQIKYFKKFGVQEFVVCAGYRANQVINYLNAKDLGVQFHYSIEKKPLGTGGAILKARKFLDDDSFFVINGDVITNIDLRRLDSNQNAVAVIPLRTPFGIVHMQGKKIERFEEKPEIFDYWMNAGIYHLRNDIFEYLPKIGNIETTTFPALAKKGKIYAEKFEKAFWYSIDSYKDIEECAKEMRTKHYENFVK